MRHFIVEYVHSIREQSPGIGGEKLWLMYQAFFGPEYSIGRDAFLNVLRNHGLMLRKRHLSVRTTDSDHALMIYPDLINDLLITHPNQVWVSDITYIRIRDFFCFLSLITDAYTHEIIGWKVGGTLEASHTLAALEMAWQNKLKGKPTPDLIHHSDRGVQYASLLYTSYLKKYNIQISMTQNGNPKDNAIAERVNGILKREFLYFENFETIDQARNRVEEVIDFYNNKRLHRSLNMMTPAQVANLSGPIPKRWKCYKDKYRYSCQQRQTAVHLQ